MVAVTRSTRLPAPPEVVWTHATTMGPINQEMAPWLRMTVPREAEGLSLADVAPQLGTPLFTSWILFLGWFPVDRMRVTLVELEPGRRFVEASEVLVLRSWRHTRTIEPDGDGCVVTDTIEAAPRIGGMAPVLRWFLGWFFGHRHRRLMRRFEP